LEGLLAGADRDSAYLGPVQIRIEYRPHADISRSGIFDEEKIF